MCAWFLQTGPLNFAVFCTVVGYLNMIVISNCVSMHATIMNEKSFVTGCRCEIVKWLMYQNFTVFTWIMTTRFFCKIYYIREHTQLMNGGWSNFLKDFEPMTLPLNSVYISHENICWIDYYIPFTPCALLYYILTK